MASKTQTLAALAVSALALAACDGRRDGAPRVAGLCADFKTAAAPASGPLADGPAAVEQCVQRWAYALAGGRDSAELVAEAAAGACATQLTRWNQQALAQPAAAGEAASILTGQPTTPLAEHYAFTQSRALFHVLTARAGRCAAPPVKNGAPEGVG